MALQTLISIAENVIHKPKEEKFRRLKQSNAAVRRKLTEVPGGSACLRSMGFSEDTHEGEAIWSAPADRDTFDMLIDTKGRFAIELERLVETPLDVDKSNKANGPGGIEGFLAQALEDPASFRRFTQNPMISQLAKANPQMVEAALASPAAQAALQSHPEMRGLVEEFTGRPISVGPSAVPSICEVPSAGSAAGYGPQLAQLRDMGFNDLAACTLALQQANGDVEVALVFLVGQ